MQTNDEIRERRFQARLDRRVEALAQHFTQRLPGQRLVVHSVTPKRRNSPHSDDHRRRNVALVESLGMVGKALCIG